MFINTINPCWDWRLMRYRWSDYRRSLSGLLHVCHAKYAWQSDWAHSSLLCLVFSSLTINSFTILVYNWETTIIIASTYNYQLTRYIITTPHTFTFYYDMYYLLLPLLTWWWIQWNLRKRSWNPLFSFLQWIMISVLYF